MKDFTTIGIFLAGPHAPILFVVQAEDVKGAIHAAEQAATALDEESPFVNQFVLAGKCEVLSTWAG